MASLNVADVAVEDVVVTFGGVRAVSGCSFRAEAGCATALIGANGAGKSTMLDVVAGFRRPDRGCVHIAGEDATSLSPQERFRRGVVRTFQRGGEFPRLTVLENVVLGAGPLRGERLSQVFFSPRRSAGEERETILRACALLEEFDLFDLRNAYACELSGGQVKILDFCRALIAEPRLLLLDEPFAGVNHKLGSRIEAAIMGRVEHGLTVLLIEHQMATVGRLCPKVIVMGAGRVVSEGSLEDIRSRAEVKDAFLRA